MDEKLIKEKLIYLCGIYDTDIDIEDDGVIILDREHEYKSFAEALISWEDYLLETKGGLLSDFEDEQQEILDIIEELKKENEDTMMNKEEFATLIDALRFNTRILNEKLGEQELIFNSLLELQETIDGQLSTLEEELEKRNLLDEYRYIELDDEGISELRAGDYISESNIEEKYSKGDYVLSKIVKCGNKYTRLFIKGNTVDDKLYATIDDLKADLHDSAYFYYIDDNFDSFGVGNYMIYDPENEVDYEIEVEYDEDCRLRIFLSGADDYFDEDEFDTIEEVESYLRADYKLIEKLRYSIHY